MSSIDPTTFWRDAVEARADASLGHAAEWFTVIRRAYGHTPLYLSATDEDGSPALLPAFIVRRPLVGTVVTSMPFLDSGGPCTASAPLAQVLVERLVAEGRRVGARAIELRCSRRLDLGVAPAEHKVNLTLSLDGDADRVWRALGKSVRNQVRKAERAQLSVEIGGAELLPAFYEAFVSRMRDLGSPVHGRAFLRAVLDGFGGRARVFLARKDQSAVGGLIALRFKDRVVVPWAASMKEWLSLCPNMLLYWEAIRAACADGLRRFEFGRSTRGSGTYHFKRQWGAREEPLYWYTIPLAHAPAASTAGGSSTAAALLSSAWRHLPLVATRVLGPRIRTYLIQ
jgi:FemAB-related protein (PEP-CTERM system-associated)